MSKQRLEDEKERTYFRSTDRVVHGGDGFYFVLREGDQLGPYRTKQIAASRGHDTICHLMKEHEAREDVQRLLRGQTIDVAETESGAESGWDQIPEIKRTL